MKHDSKMGRHGSRMKVPAFPTHSHVMIMKVYSKWSSKQKIGVLLALSMNDCWYFFVGSTMH